MGDPTVRVTTEVSSPDGMFTFVIDSGTEVESSVSVGVPKVKPFVLTDTTDASFALVRRRASGELVHWEGDGEGLAETVVEDTVTLSHCDGSNIQWTVAYGPYIVRTWRDSDGEVCRIEFSILPGE